MYIYIYVYGMYLTTISHITNISIHFLNDTMFIVQNKVTNITWLRVSSLFLTVGICEQNHFSTHVLKWQQGKVIDIEYIGKRLSLVSLRSNSKITSYLP